MSTASDFIAGRGGSSAVASLLDVPADRVRVWKHRNKIPRDAWPDIQIAFPDVTLADLLAIEKASAEAVAS